MSRVVSIDWSPDFVNWVFLWWYNHNRPNAHKLYMGLPRPQSTEYPAEFLKFHFGIPNAVVLRSWIDADFIHRAGQLDAEARQTMDTELVAVKVEMLRRHARVGEEMQNMAIDYLNTHKDDLGVNNAVKLLVEGLRIERESSGIPDTLRKMSEMSDDRLMSEIKALLSNSPSEILPPDEDDIPDEENIIDVSETI